MPPSRLKRKKENKHMSALNANIDQLKEIMSGAQAKQNV